MESTDVNGSNNVAEEQGVVTENSSSLGDVSKSNIETAANIPRDKSDNGMSVKTPGQANDMGDGEAEKDKMIGNEMANSVGPDADEQIVENDIDSTVENQTVHDDMQLSNEHEKSAEIHVGVTNESKQSEEDVENGHEIVANREDNGVTNESEQSEEDMKNGHEVVAKREDVGVTNESEQSEEDMENGHEVVAKREDVGVTNESEQSEEDIENGHEVVAKREDVGLLHNEAGQDHSSTVEENKEAVIESKDTDQLLNDAGDEAEEALVTDNVSNDVKEDLGSEDCNITSSSIRTEPSQSITEVPETIDHTITKTQELDGDNDNTESTQQADKKMDEEVKESAVESEASVEDAEMLLNEKPKENEWLDMLGNGLLKKKVLVPGKGPDSRPKPGDEVTLIVNGELKDGAKLKEEKIVFIIDDRDVIQALEMAVALMEVGEKALLYTNSKYAYGPFGCDETEPVIPKNCDITYEVELIAVTEGPDKEQLSNAERVEIADKKRLRGNSLYTRGDFGGAIECYKRGLKYLEGSASEEVIEMKVKCQNNLSASQLKVNAFQAALQSCNNVLRLQSENVKAIFRKAKCLEALGDTREALKCLKEASMLDPNNKLVHSELTRVGKYVKQSSQKESDMYKRMVEGLKKEKPKDETTDDSFSFKVMVGTLLVVGMGVLAGFLWNKH
ncbi:uncharacterized protein LOC135689134 [Rhopilema esculentum]|uniref:uncharacterized protein LOC135689134 n=1 Tax=Rhopilema esculentum TaxID=499914 RepID=UPI0031DFA29D|eukprot:gene7761-13604_t